MRWGLRIKGFVSLFNKSSATSLSPSPAGSGCDRASDEPDREFDQGCRIRRMHYLMRKVETDAADNNSLEADRLDIMSALVVARENCRKDDIQQCRLFIQSVTALARFLGFRNEFDERVRWGKAALEVAERLNDDLAIAELCASIIAWPLLQQGNHDEAKQYSLRGLAAAQRSGNSAIAAKWAGNAARTLSGIARDNMDGPDAYYWAEQAATYARSCSDGILIRGAELDFGYAALLRGDFLEAENRFRSLVEFEEKGHDEERISNRSGDLAIAITNRAIRSHSDAEKFRLFEQVDVLIERGSSLAKKLNHPVMLGEGDIFRAVLARARGDETEYLRLIRSGRRRFAEIGIRRKGRAEQFISFPDL